MFLSISKKIGDLTFEITLVVPPLVKNFPRIIHYLAYNRPPLLITPGQMHPD